jgi:hypothetical protein
MLFLQSVDAKGTKKKFENQWLTSFRFKGRFKASSLSKNKGTGNSGIQYVVGF